MDAMQSDELYLALIIGDRQVRQIVGRTEAPSMSENVQQSHRALDHFMRLSAPTASSSR